MKYVMLAILSVLYMSSVAYGNADCPNKGKLSAFSSKGQLTPQDPILTTSDGRR